MNNDRLPLRGTSNQTIAAAMLAFVAPFVILISMFALAGIAPFGQSTLLCSYNAEWFRELGHWRSVLSGDAGLMYSFADGLGGDFYSRWADGLCSPFLLLILTMGSGELPQSFAVITLVRASCAGLFAYFMLRQLAGRTPMSAAAFAVAYASGSQLALSFLAPRYADAAVLLPLAAAGIAVLAEHGKATLFFCSAVTYLMCCGRLWPLLIFFSVCYFVWCQLVLGRHDGLWARLGLFIASIAASVGGAMLTLMPVFAINAERSAAIYPVGQVDSPGIFDLLGSMFSGAFTDGVTMPLMFCSTITVLMLPLYFLNSRLPLGERQLCALFLVLLTLSLCIPALCWLWLGFSVPTEAVCCGGCIFCLFAVSAAVRLTAQPMRVKVSRVLLSWMIVAGIFLASLIFGGMDYSLAGIIFTAGFLTMYAAITIISLSGQGISVGFCVVILVCVGCECALGGMLGLQSAADTIPLVSASDLEQDNRQQADLDSIIVGSELSGSSGFFRIRGADAKGAGRADVSWAATDDSGKLMSVLGISGGEGFTPVTDSLFGVKYVVSQEPSRTYPSVGTTGDLTVHRNDLALGLCLAASADSLEMTSFSMNPFTAQNELATSIAGAERRLFIDASLSARDGEGASIIETMDGIELVRSADEGLVHFTVLIPSDGPLYMYLGARESSVETVSVGNTVLGQMDLGAIQYIGRFTRGTLITVSVTVTDERLALGGTWFAVMDTALTDTAMAQLARQNAAYINAEGNTVTCTATVSEGQIFLTTLPWQPGWRAYVNGMEVDTVCAAGALLGVNTGAGIHDIRLVYETGDFAICLIISAVFLIFGFMLTCILDSDRLSQIYENNRRMAEAEEMAPLPVQEDMFATYSSYMIPDVPSLDDQEDDFEDYFNGM